MRVYFVAAWAVWLAGIFVIEFWLDPHAMLSALPVMLTLFVLIEGAALIYEGAGDTLSEQVWSFYGGHPARIPWVVGFTGYMSIRLLEIGVQVPFYIGRANLGRMVLVIGLGVGLVLHFLGRGRWG